MRIAVDTNILIYILQADPRFGRPASLVLSSFSKDNIIASEAIFAEILSATVFKANETARNRTLRFLETADITYIPTDRQIYLEAARLRRLRPSLKLPDALHLATAWLHKAAAFVTNDDDLVRLSTGDRKILRLDKFAEGLPAAN